LITLTGSGGVGKTRLAIQVVAEILDRFPDGLWFLDLAPLNDPALIPNTLANLLGLRESGEIAVTELLINYFRTRTGLVIFDNCEHLIDASAQLIHSLLTSCKNIAILATSRETLRVAGELPYRVPSLKIPKPSTKLNFLEISSIEAVKLFVDRAKIAAASFALSQQNAETVAQICQRVDGIPLAIELAAARSNMLPLEQVLKRLDDRFDLLTGGSRTALPRHQTLQALIDWSYDLLLEPEYMLLRRLSVFAGGWTLDAAEFVCIGDGVEVQATLDLMTQLANKSLVISARTRDQEARYRMLETIRQYASERLLTSGESDQTHNRHFEYFLQWVERVEPRLRGPQQLESLDQFESELDNLRAALDWSLARAELGEASLRLAGALLPFCDQRGYMSEGRAWLARALDNQAAPKSGAARAKALNAAGFLTHGWGDAAKSRALLEESVTLWLELGQAGKSGLAYAWADLGEVMRISGDPTKARSLESDAVALFREQDDRWGLAYALSHLGLAIRDQGDFALARSVINESIVLWRDLGVFWELVMANRFLGLVALRQGDYQLAQRYFADWVELARKLNNKESLAWAILDMGEATLCLNDRVRAKSFMEESHSLFQELDNKLGMANSLYYLGLLTTSEGNNQQPKKNLEQALMLAREVGPMWLCADALMGLAGVAAARGQGTQAARVLGAAEAQLEAVASYWNAAENTYIERIVASATAQLGAAAFAAARAEGRTMAFEQAADYALRGLQ
jgi:non-specific serine/threonine protein kinase